MSKEWKGNKKSVSTMLGMSTTWHPENRAAGDYYTTDPTAVEQFINHLHNLVGFININPIDTIWDPACGCGNISKVLIKHGYRVYSSDLYDRGFGEDGIDFLQTTKVPDTCSTIITNPPYSLADEFVKHAMEILPDGGRYFALMNISYLAGQKRFKEIFSNGYLYAIHVYTHRINCYKNNQNTVHSSPVNYGWFEYCKNSVIKQKCENGIIQFTCRIPPVIYWIEK